MDPEGSSLAPFAHSHAGKDFNQSVGLPAKTILERHELSIKSLLFHPSRESASFSPSPPQRNIFKCVCYIPTGGETHPPISPRFLLTIAHKCLSLGLVHELKKKQQLRTLSSSLHSRRDVVLWLSIWVDRAGQGRNQHSEADFRKEGTSALWELADLLITMLVFKN